MRRSGFSPDRPRRGRRRQPSRHRHRRLVSHRLPHVASRQAEHPRRRLPHPQEGCAEGGRPARNSAGLGHSGHAADPIKWLDDLAFRRPSVAALAGAGEESARGRFGYCWLYVPPTVRRRAREDLTLCGRSRALMGRRRGKRFGPLWPTPISTCRWRPFTLGWPHSGDQGAGGPPGSR